MNNTEPLPKNTELWKCLLLLTLLFIGVLVNLKVLYAVLNLPRRKQKRPDSILVIHLSVVAICFAVLNALLVAEDGKLINLKGPVVCSIISFLKRSVVGIFSLNIVALLFERFHTFNYFNKGKLRLRKLILLVWTIAIITSIPSAFTVVYKELDFNEVFGDNTTNSAKHGKCQAVSLFGSIQVSAAYEIFRLLVFHVVVVVYMVYAMCKIRASISQLYLLKPIPDAKTQQKVTNIRFFYLHLLSFCIIWIPYGVLTVGERIIGRTQIVKTLNTNSCLRSFLGLLLYIYMILNPVIYLLLMPHQSRNLKRKENIKLAEIQHPAKADSEEDVQRNAKSGAENVEELVENPIPSQVQFTSVEMSRVSTFMRTTSTTTISCAKSTLV